MAPAFESHRTFDAVRFRQNIVSALEGDPVMDPRIADFSMMKEFKWTYDELLDTPFHVIVSIGFIKDSTATFNKLQKLKGKE